MKILEALGMGKAVVATSLAAEGIDLRPGEDLELADTPEEFARACARLLADPARRRRLGSAGRDRVRARYGWSAIGESFNQMLLAHHSGLQEVGDRGPALVAASRRT